MLSAAILDRILQRLPALTLGVVGDLFLDRYLDLDATLTEPSIETGFDAYQVTRVRSCPGAAGTVINNLIALGVGTVVPVSVIGADGEGYELRQALTNLQRVRLDAVFNADGRRTPTYTKPMLHAPSQPARELNRLDIKNRTPLPAAAERQLLDRLSDDWLNTLDGLLVLDQVSEENCGVITTKVREQLSRYGAAHPAKIILADSRERIGLFTSIRIKPNLTEGAKALNRPPNPDSVLEVAAELAGKIGQTVFCTCGERGIAVAHPEVKVQAPTLVPGYPVTGPIDIVGAGDSTSAAITCALVAGATATEAAAFGNLVASITIQQLGVTGTASPEQLRRRWQELSQE